MSDRRAREREKIFVLGHSRGSVLGLWLAHEHPELIYAFVGVGQVIQYAAERGGFAGRHDPYCPPSLIWECGQTIKAPQKEFIWFENSGHFPFFEEQQKFADELFQKVLPLTDYRPVASLVTVAGPHQNPLRNRASRGGKSWQVGISSGNQALTRCACTDPRTDNF